VANLNFIQDGLIFVPKRKPVLLIDGSEKSQQAVMLLKSKGIEYVEYDMRKFTESCCGDLPTTRAPSVFAPEGVFKDLEGIREFVNMDRKDSTLESESAYW
jgi:hypothetical protein